jgi:methylthioribose-1-phosphate isomerase
MVKLPYTLWIEGDRVLTWDQRLLPFREEVIELSTWQQAAHAIRSMQVRGAPLIGVTAAFGVALGLRELAGSGHLESSTSAQTGLDEICASLMATRPTAVNLAWGVNQVRNAVAQARPADWARVAWARALDLHAADAQCNADIGKHGLIAWEALIDRAKGEARPLQILTHCNAGALATVAWGTALAPVYQAHQQGIAVHVWVDETRPRNQGASLTAWELARAGVPHTVIADNAGGLLMMRGQVDLVIVGCDRVAANGDVVNKIGTYLKALAAQAHQIAFWVACPISTIDRDTPGGMQVEIEERPASEVEQMHGLVEDQGSALYQQIVGVRVVPVGSAVLNPAFDITPAALVSGLITERGTIPATGEAIRRVLALEAA